jgi:hypothetical protein
VRAHELVAFFMNEDLPPLRAHERQAYAHLLRELFAPLSPAYIAMRQRLANVTAEGLRPYRRFMHELFSLSLSTYLGGEHGVSYSKQDRSAHFEWCLAQALERTLSDGYRYQENEELIDYLRAYVFARVYHPAKMPTLAELDTLLLPDPEKISARSELNDFLALWNIFERTPRRGRRLTGRVRIPS